MIDSPSYLGNATHVKKFAGIIACSRYKSRAGLLTYGFLQVRSARRLDYVLGRRGETCKSEIVMYRNSLLGTIISRVLGDLSWLFKRPAQQRADVLVRPMDAY